MRYGDTEYQYQILWQGRVAVGGNKSDRYKAIALYTKVYGYVS
jgi:hypothetical protein